MSMARRFKGQPVTQLIVSVPQATVDKVDGTLKTRRHHPARGCRAEWVRLAIEEKLRREAPSDDFQNHQRAREV